MKYNRETLFTELKKKLFTDKFTGPHSPKQIEGINLLLDEGEKRELPVDTFAYIMATVYRETAWTMQPIKEMGTDAYLKGKKYWPYIGRGYAQLTWKYNYEKVDKKYGIDSVNNPDLVMEDQYAIPILFDGMEEGWFSGKKLSDYIDNVDEGHDADEIEFENARKVVNGSDKKKVYADLAWEWRRILNASLITNSNPINKSTTVVAGGVSTIAGGTLLIDPIKDLAGALDAQKTAFSSGSLAIVLVGVLIVLSSAYVVWARWDAAGRPQFWKGNK